MLRGSRLGGSRAASSRLESARGPFSGPAFSPAGLFRNSEAGLWIDPSDMATAFTDTAGTGPALLGMAVARMSDKSGNGLHATQATAAARPLLGRHPASGLRQRLIRSEDMSQDWAPEGVTMTESTIAPPPGLGRVWEVRETATPAGHRVRASGVAVAVGRAYTSSIFARAGSVSSLHVTHFDTGGAWSGTATFDLAAGTTTSPAISSITPVGNGWYRCTLTTPAAAGSSGNSQIIWGLRGTGSYPGNTDQFVYITGRMNEVGGSVTPYQNAATSLLDVTEAGQRSAFYLRDDGVNDALLANLPDMGTEATVAYASDLGVTVLTGQTIAAGAFDVLRDQRLYGIVVNNRPWLAGEVSAVTGWLSARGVG